MVQLDKVLGTTYFKIKGRIKLSEIDGTKISCYTSKIVCRCFSDAVLPTPNRPPNNELPPGHSIDDRWSNWSNVRGFTKFNRANLVRGGRTTSLQPERLKTKHLSHSSFRAKSVH